MNAVLQQVFCTFDIDQILTPVYYPQVSPVERKNRDLKPCLAILIDDTFDRWSEKLPSIRFALNSSKSDTIGHISTYLKFGRELRRTFNVVHYQKFCGRHITLFLISRVLETLDHDLKDC
ncbi:reverse transcriptase [Caerostris darwini]|uniref:Reverse transcriptase n=1 Tax=Caerostris darwini TaxID=1538125 RepID=A0AAV4VSW3_9ARAC|nr:reverse transcriptase [Caerostris darwini]